MGKPQRSRLVRRRQNNSKASFAVERLESRMLLAANPLAPEHVEGELLVQFVANTSAAERAAARASIAGEVRETIHTRTMQRSGAGPLERISLAQGMDLQAAIDLIERNPRVAFAEPNYIYRHSAVSNDTYYTNGSQWGVYGPDTPPVGPSGTTNPFGTHAENVWNKGLTGSTNVFIGVIDEGIQVSHPDLIDNIWVNPFEIDGDGVDNDGNGYVDDINGWDFANDDNSVFDGAGDDHGTHVAGTIGAKGGNNAGVAGVAWTVKMISAKFLGPSGGSLSAAVKSVDYITDLKVRHGMNVVATNNSWGGGGYSEALHNALIRQAKQEILFAAAAGNGGTDNDAAPFYPANYDTSVGTSTETAASYDAVIAVANITSSGDLNPGSQYGATTVDIGAPGTDIWSTVPSNSYSSYTGTSMATPHVSGALALISSGLSSPMPAAELKQVILDFATPTPSLVGKTVTGGRLNVDAAINFDEDPPVISNITASPGSNSAIVAWLTDEPSSSDVFYGTSPDNLNLSVLNSSKVLAHQVTLSGLTTQQTYYYRVRSTDAAGNTSTSTVRSFTTRFGNSGIITNLTDVWKRVTFTNPLTNAVVVMGTPSRLGGDPVTVRVRNLNSTGFEVRIDEWEYQDGRHGIEEVAYFAIESGTHRLPDGSIIKAGKTTLNHRWTNVSLTGDGTFTSTPIVFSQVLSTRENVAVTTRHRSVSSTGFEVMIQEEQGADRIHLAESVGWIAVQPGRRTFGGNTIESAMTPNQVTHLTQNINFQSSFATRPVFLAQMQTTNDADTATVRYRSLSNRAASIYLEEERSFDAETAHGTEVVGWLALGSIAAPPPGGMRAMNVAAPTSPASNSAAALTMSQLLQSDSRLNALSSESLLDDGMAGDFTGLFQPQPCKPETQPTQASQGDGSTNPARLEREANQAARKAKRAERVANRLAQRQARLGLNAAQPDADSV